MQIKKHNEISLHACQDGYYKKMTSVGEIVEKLELLYTIGENGIGTAIMENTRDVP